MDVRLIGLEEWELGVETRREAAYSGKGTYEVTPNACQRWNSRHWGSTICRYEVYISSCNITGQI